MFPVLLLLLLLLLMFHIHARVYSLVQVRSSMGEETQGERFPGQEHAEKQQVLLTQKW